MEVGLQAEAGLQDTQAILCLLKSLDHLRIVCDFIVEATASMECISFHMEQARVFTEVALEDTLEHQSHVNERMEVHVVVVHVIRGEMQEEMMKISRNEDQQRQMKSRIKSKESALKDVRHSLDRVNENKKVAERKLKIVAAATVVTNVVSIPLILLVPEIGIPARIAAGVVAGANTFTNLAVTINRSRKLEREFTSQINDYQDTLRSVNSDIRDLEQSLRGLKGQRRLYQKEIEKIEMENDALYQTLQQSSDLIQVLHGCSEFMSLLQGRVSEASATTVCLAEGDVETFLVTLNEIAKLLQCRDGSWYTRVMHTIDAVQATGEKLGVAINERAALESERRDCLGYI